MSGLEVPPSLSEGKVNIVETAEFFCLYLDRPEALLHFLNVKAPIPLDTLLENNSLVAYLVSKEPGPNIQHAGVRRVLQATRGWFLASPTRTKLMEFYNDYLQLRSRWLMAKVEAIAFATHSHLTQAIYFAKGNKPLIEIFKTQLPNVDLDSKLKDFPAMTIDQYLQVMTPTYQRLRIKADDLDKKLSEIKSSEEMRVAHGALLNCIHAYQTSVMAVKNREYEKRVRIHQAQQRNNATTRRQMGNAGKNPLAPRVVRTVKEFVREEQQKYLTFDNAGQ